MKQDSLKSLRKSLLTKIEGKLSESLTEFPKKISEKKYKRIIRKAGKILTKSLFINPVRSADQKKERKKTRRTEQESKTENIQAL